MDVRGAHERCDMRTSEKCVLMEELKEKLIFHKFCFFFLLLSPAAIKISTKIERKRYIHDWATEWVHIATRYATNGKRMKWRKASNFFIRRKKNMCRSSLHHHWYLHHHFKLFSWCYHFQFASSFNVEFWVLSHFFFDSHSFSHFGICLNQNLEMSVYTYVYKRCGGSTKVAIIKIDSLHV